MSWLPSPRPSPKGEGERLFVPNVRYVFLGLYLALCATVALGQTSSKRAATVAWEAPEELRPLLEKHLVPPEVLDDEERPGAYRPFVREVNRRVPEIAAAEGWFSAKVETKIEGEGDHRRVRVIVTPGPRTKVASVEIAFEGDVAGEGAEREARRKEVREAWTLREGEPFRNSE